MKKKFLLVVFIFMSLFLITGCSSVPEKTRNDIVKKLKTEEIIKDDWKLIDTVIYVGCLDLLGAEDYYYYVYSDNNQNMYMIKIRFWENRDGNNIYAISLYPNILKDESLGTFLQKNEKDLYDECPRYYYGDDTVKDMNIYYTNDIDEIDYKIQEEKKFLFKKYTIIE